MKRPFLAALLAMGTAALPIAAHAQVDQQALVDRATLAAQEILIDNGAQAVSLLRQARAVMICPRVMKAGFILGAEGGGCVLLARDGAGSWSSPAFYTMGSGSIGFQIGLQDSEVMMMILTDRGLNAILDDQFKIGADASVAVVTIGAGIQGATTAAAGADIVAFARSRGLFAGVSLSGSLLGSDSGADRAYYGRDVGARQIVLQMQANNPAASPLRELLMRSGGPGAPVTRPTAAYARPGYPQPGYPQPAYPQPGYQQPGYPAQGAPPGYAPALPAYSPPAAAPQGTSGYTGPTGFGPAPGWGPGDTYAAPSGAVQAQPLSAPRR